MAKSLLLAAALLISAIANGGAQTQPALIPVSGGACDAASPTSSACNLSPLTMTNVTLTPGTVTFVTFTNVKSIKEIDYEGVIYNVTGRGAGPATLGWLFGGASDITAVSACVQYLYQTTGAISCSSINGMFFSIGWLPVETVRNGSAYLRSSNVAFSGLNSPLVSQSQLQSAGNNTIIIFSAQLSTVSTNNWFQITGVQLVKGSALHTSPLSVWVLLLAALLALSARAW